MGSSTMKTAGKFFGIALAGSLALALFACDQPFRAGLGSIVDAERPGIRLVSPGGGTFIRADTTFGGEAWDDVRVEAVQFMITSHPGFRTGLSDEEQEGLLSWRDVQSLAASGRSGNKIVREWSHTVKTGDFRDGELHISLRVSDGVVRDGSQWQETDYIAFFIRNTPPAIVLGLPSVDEVTGEDDTTGRLGGRHLNYNFIGDGFARLVRRVDGNAGMITGMIRDDRGINTFADPTNGRFPPGFRLWEIADPLTMDRHEALEGIPRIPSDYESLAKAMEDLPWREFGGQGNGALIPISQTSMQFFYSFPVEAQGRYFAFQIRAQSEAINGEFQNFLFPRDEWGYFAELDPDEQIENSFVAFLIVAPQVPPELELLAFQDIFGQNGWTDGPDYNDMPGYSDDTPHPLITDLAFNAKDGAFTLRVRLRHDDGVSEAMAFWEGDGRRGRFIWDPVHEDPRPGWNPSDNVPATRSFSEWGRRDPKLSEPNIPNFRNFVFTYKGGDPMDRVPDSLEFNHLVRGGYRIQEFAGTAEEWNLLYGGIGDPLGWFLFRDSPLWRDDPWVEKGTEGIFSIRVYARTEQGTVNTMPLMTFLTLDKKPPVLELTQLDGSAGESGVPGGRTAHVVNGVIRPRLFASDARSSDSGPRVSGGYFARPDGRSAEEVMYLLVPDAHRAAMEGLPPNFWPLPRAAGSGSAPVFPGGLNLAVSRHGPVLDGTALIQTSRSHADNRHEPLPDGLYWLYIFAQDRAFNVGRESFPLIVDAESDLPVFDFGIGLMNPAVTNPNQSADGTPQGFAYGGSVRNILRPTSDIRFRLRDDDGLNLGLNAEGPGAATSMRISLTGSFIYREGEEDGEDEIRPLTERGAGYLVAFSDEQLKSIFRPSDSEDSSALHEREGTIPQSLLLDLLRANPIYRAMHYYTDTNGNTVNTLDGRNSLPDGIYRIRMEVSDDPGFKLTMPGEAASASTASVEFWVAVDGVPPVVNLEAFSPTNEAYIPFDEIINLGSPQDSPVPVVWDDNGPVTATGFRVVASSIIWTENGNLPVQMELDIHNTPGFDSVGLVRNHRNPDTWEHFLRAPVNITKFFPGLESGIFDFELTLTDRFGNSTLVTRRHKLDHTRPTVTLTKPIDTFSRPSVAGWYPSQDGDNRIHISGANAGRLANKTISFAAHAHDNFTVSGIHWWLLPSDTGAFTGADDLDPGGLNKTGLVQNFFSFPAGLEDPQAALGANGAFGRISPPGGQVFIDTSGLNDGEYRLHIIAKDVWGNFSLVREGAIKDNPVFLLQEEDRPYFSGIEPNVGVNGYVRGEHGLFITGSIMDDDGFGTTIIPEAGSVRIWVSRSAFTQAPGSSAFANVYGEGTEVTGSHLILSGRDIILNIDLIALFPNLLDGSDGSIHYVIQAQDAWQSKLQMPGTQDRTRMSRQRQFSFVLDTQPPVIELVSPSVGDSRIFRKDFNLVGHIADVNLSTMLVNGENRPYVYWSLNGERPPKSFALPSGIETGTGKNQKVDFNISASSIFAGLGGFDALAEGHYSLELTVTDMIGMASVATLNFTVDRNPPVIRANFPTSGVEIGDDVYSWFVDNNFDWFDKGAFDWFDWWHRQPVGEKQRREWNEIRRRWAAEQDLPVIFHDGTTPILTGGVVDVFSDILTDEVAFRFNNGEVPLSVGWEGEGRNCRWEIPLATAGGILPDGVHTLSIMNARDSTGNEAPRAIFVFRIDSRAPDLALDEQHDNYYVLGSPGKFPDNAPVFSIGGTARDANLSEVRLRFREQQPGGLVVHEVNIVKDSEEAPTVQGGIRKTWNWDNTDGTKLTWSYDLGLEIFRREFVPGLSYEIEAVAMDWRGGASEPFLWVFTQDTLGPEISFASGLNPHDLGASLGPRELVPGHLAFHEFKSQSLVIQGTVSDRERHNSNISGVERIIQRWDWDHGDWREALGWDRIAPEQNLSTPTLTWRTEDLGESGANLPDGLYRIRVRAMDSAWFGGNLNDFGSAIGNTGESGWLYFYFDRSPVELAFALNPPQTMSSRFGTDAGEANSLGFRVAAGSAVRLRKITATITPRPNVEGIGTVSLPIFGEGEFGNQAGGTFDLRLRVPFDGPDRFQDGIHTLSIKVENLAGKEAIITRTLGLDNTSPGGSFTSPELAGSAGEDGFDFTFSVPHLGSASAVISGETFDRLVGTVESGIARVDFRLGLLLRDGGNPDNPADWIWPNPERLALHYTGEGYASDSRRNDGIFDNGLGSNATERTWFRLRANEPMPLGFAIDRDNPFSWQLRVGEGSHSLLYHAERAGGSRRVGHLLEMPIWFRVVDGVGNAGYFHRVIRIDPEADRPRNLIHNPSSDGLQNAPRGGNVGFDGLAEIGADHVQVRSVLYRVWVGIGPNAGLRPEPVSVNEMPGLAPSLVSSSGIEREILERYKLWAEDAWFHASLGDSGNIVPWNFNLNAGGELTALIASHGFGSVTGSSTTNPNDMIFVQVEVLAINNGTPAKTSTGTGTVEEPKPSLRTFYLRSGAPVIYPDLDSLADPGNRGGAAFVKGIANQGTGPNNPHRGLFTITAYLDATEGQTISEVRILRPDETLDGTNLPVGLAGNSGLAGLSLTPVTSFGGHSFPAGRVYRLVYHLDSSAMPGSVDGVAAGAIRWRNWVEDTGGTYRVEIRVRDSMSPPAETTLSLPIVIDDFAPVADGSHGSRANPVQAGTMGLFQGRALDGIYGNGAAGVDRIYAWFRSRIDGEFVSLDGTAGPAPGGSFAGTWLNREVPPNWDGTTAGLGAGIPNQTIGTPGPIPVPNPNASAGQPGSDSWVGDSWIMRISAQTSSTVDGRGRGQLWMAADNARLVDWQFVVDTTMLPDGPLTLEYIIVDSAGNASFHRQEDIVIRNRFPEFSRIVLHTSADGLPPVIEGNALVIDPNISTALGWNTLNETRPDGHIVPDFTVRNRYLGFTVETISGNAPLSYRVQAVTRLGPHVLNQERLEAMIADRNAGRGINLYTVESTGSVGPDVQARLGIVGGAAPGRHFVFMPTSLSEIRDDLAEGHGTAAVNLDMTVYSYALIPGTQSRETPPIGTRNQANLPVGLGTGREHGLFFGDKDFAATVADPNGIRNGDNFFLVRVWDSVSATDPANPESGPGFENRQLHAAAVMRLDVRLFDLLAPDLTIHPLMPGFLDGVASGSNLTPEARNRTRANALAPQEVGRDLDGNFIETNSARGGLFNVGTSAGDPAKSGYIEPAAYRIDGGRTPNADAVSGRVILRGRATDNDRVQSISLAITTGGAAAGDNDWFEILRWDAAARKMEVVQRQATGSGNSFRLPPEGGVPLADVGVMETLHWRDGHVVEWAFLWDTELVNNANPLGNVRLSVRVTDHQDVELPANHLDEGSFLVDIVPYLSGISRQPQYATIRSMQGWYSFYRGETGISALGWNLGLAAPSVPTSTVNPGIQLAALANLAVTPAERADPLSGYHLGGSRRISFGIPGDAHSGRLNLLVGGTPIYNHLSDPRLDWNREDILGARSRLWLNRPYAHVWRSRDSLDAGTGAPHTFMGPKANSVDLSHPGMALEFVGTGSGPISGLSPSAGRLHGTWSVYGNANVHYGRNDAWGIGAASNVTAISTGNPPNEPLVNPDIGIFRGSIAGADNWPNIAFVNQRDGRPDVMIRARPGVQEAVNGTNTPTILAGDNVPTNRWRNIRVANAAVNGLGSSNPGRLYTTVYDSFNKALVFVARNGVDDIRVNIDGGISPDSGAGSIDNITNLAGGAGVARSSDAGLFSAVGFDGGTTSGMNPLVAYFDSANNTLRIAFGTGAAPAAANWTRHDVLPPGHLLRGGSGRYVSMAVEPGNGRIHLAFFNQRLGALVYTSGHRNSIADFAANARVVDTTDGVGRWTDISLDQWGNPWIVYAYQGRQGNFDGIRMAYLSHGETHINGMGANTRFDRPNFCRVTGGSIQGWEAVQMAAPFRVAYDRLNIAAWPPARDDGVVSTMGVIGTAGRAWGAAIGYASATGDNRFRIGYFFWPNVAFGGNMSP